jgi:hypothetical protein
MSVRVKLKAGGMEKLVKASEELKIIADLEDRAEEIERVWEQAEKLDGAPLGSSLDAVESLVERMDEGQPYQQLTIHRYLPPDGLDGALSFMEGPIAAAKAAPR